MKRILFYVGSIVLTSAIISACGGDNSGKTYENTSTKNNEQTSIDSTKQTKEKEPEKAYIQVFTRNGVVFDQPCQSKIILCIKSGIVRAIHTNCEDEYALFDYLDGKADGLVFSGKGSYFDNCGGSDPTKNMCKSTKNFKMELDKDSSKIKFNGTKFSKSSSKLSFKTNGMKLYKSPDSNSELMEKIKDSKGIVELLGIGELQKKGSEWGIWYNVKVNEKEGWCLDCMNF